MKQLVIAEKPSVAKDLAKALGGFKTNKAGYFERDDMILSSALGHLVELYLPGDIDKKYKFWTLGNLPILPEKFQLKPIEKNAERFHFLKKLMERSDVSGLINACDAGREGELIFAYLCELANCKKPTQRLWLSSMTPDSIRDAFAHLRSAESMQPLEAAARCRSEADWLVGINGTRAVTGRMMGNRSKDVASVGRVQTPTLALICEREQAIRDFKPTPFWTLEGTFKLHSGTYTGWLQRPNFKKQQEADRSDRFWQESETQALITQLNSLKPTDWVVQDSQKISKTAAPRLFDLTSLQRTCNQRFGYSAKFTLDIAQSLYEKHKVLTYPRTDSRALPEDYSPTCINILQKLGGAYAPLATKIIEHNWVNPHSKIIFNNKAISDHFAIIPTEIAPSELKESERKVYDCVVRRFIAAFFPHAEFSITTRLTTQAELTFKTEGKILVQPGWLEVTGKSESKEELPALTLDDQGHATSDAFRVQADETHPPARFTEATLLTSMEHAGQQVEDAELAEAMKERGLGTPATRAQIIENLIGVHYLERIEKHLCPTPKAEQLLAFLRLTQVQDLASPSLTGEWEYRLNQIQDGSLNREQFMSDVKTMTKQFVEKITTFQDYQNTLKVIAPTDGKPMIETFRSYQSQDGTLVVYKTIGNRNLSPEELDTLINQKRIGPLTGFTSKLGKPYTASLVLDDDYKVKFEFESKAESTPIDLSLCELIGTCPLCGAKVYVNDQALVCEHFSQKTCGLRINRTILDYTLSNDQLVYLLNNGKTELITRFKSKRTGKFFSAYLVLNKKGSLSFEFESKTNKTTDKKQPKKAKTTKAKTKSA